MPGYEAPRHRWDVTTWDGKKGKNGITYLSDTKGTYKNIIHGDKLDRYLKKVALTVERNLKDEISRAETEAERNVKDTIRISRRLVGNRHDRYGYIISSSHEYAEFYNMKAGYTMDEWNSSPRPRLSAKWNDSWTQRAITKARRMV